MIGDRLVMLKRQVKLSDMLENKFTVNRPFSSSVAWVCIFLNYPNEEKAIFAIK